MKDQSDQQRSQFEQLAARYGVSLSAVAMLAEALRLTGGKQAQFNHPELGGMGQWMPGMVMIGDMFNHGLKARVDGLATELTGLIAAQPVANPFSFSQSMAWWPPRFGTPDSSGGQNDLRYAYFARHNRLLVQWGQQTTLYDSSGHRITGVSQQQMNGAQVLVFHTPHGAIHAETLPKVNDG